MHFSTFNSCPKWEIPTSVYWLIGLVFPFNIFGGVGHPNLKFWGCPDTHHWLGQCGCQLQSVSVSGFCRRPSRGLKWDFYPLPPHPSNPGYATVVA